MATLQQTLYQKILNVTQYAHDIVYKGDRNRNRYQLTENLFVQYNAGLVTHIFDTDKDLGLKLIMVSDSDADLVRADMIEMSFWVAQGRATSTFTPHGRLPASKRAPVRAA